MNTVSSLLTRLGLDKYISHFEAAHVESICTLRGLTELELLNYVTDPKDCSKLIFALSEACAPVPGSAEPSSQHNNKNNSPPANEHNYRNHGPRGINNNHRENHYRNHEVASVEDGHVGGEHRGDERHKRGGGIRSYRGGEPNPGYSRGGWPHGTSCNSESSSSEHWPARGRPRGGHSRSERPAGICRDFNSLNGCPYGERCRYRHVSLPVAQSLDNNQDSVTDGNPDKAVDAESVTERPRFRDFPRAPGSFETTFQILSERMKLLLAVNAKKLREIHYRYGTRNKRVDKFEECEAMVNFTLYGSQEGIYGARKEIERFVGIEKKRDEEARFQYYIHEHTNNQKALDVLAVFSAENKGTQREISQNSFKRISQYLLLTDPFAEVKQRFIISESSDRQRKQHISNLLKGMQGNVQTIIFGSWKCVNNLESYFKRHNDTRSYGGAVPVFLCPPIGKAETVAEKKLRLQNMEIFKQGTIVETSKGKVLQRLLICTDDYARYSRRHAIPYVNQIIHYNMPRTKLNYVYRLATLSRRKGSSLMIGTERDTEMVLSLINSVEDIQHLPTTENLLPYGIELLDHLEWETVDCPRTDFSNVEPKSGNWDAELDEKAAAKGKNMSMVGVRSKGKMISEIDTMDE